MSEDFSLSIVNRYQCQLSSSGVIESCSLEGNVIAENTGSTKSLKEIIVFLTIPDKNITTEIRFEDLAPRSTLEKALMSVKLNPIDNPSPVSVTELISSLGNPGEDYRVVYPLKDNKIFEKLLVKNRGTEIVPTIHLTKNIEFLSKFQKEQVHVDSGKIELEKNALTWDINDLKPGQEISLTFAADIIVGSLEPPVNSWTSLIFELSVNTENKSLWAIKKVESEIPPKTTEQVLYDLAIPENPFEVAKIVASRAITSVQLKSPEIVQVQFESTLKNQGTATLDDVEIIHQFTKAVELPNATEVSLSLRGVQVSKSNFEVNQSPHDDFPDCNIFRILFRNITSSLGGLKAGEEIRISFPLFVKLDFNQGILKYPTFFNALVKPGTPLLEETANESSLDKIQLKSNDDSLLIKSKVPESSFEAEVIMKFSKLAVEAYNARKFEDALAYCEQILSIAIKIEDKTQVNNLNNIIEKLRKIITRNVPEKGK